MISLRADSFRPLEPVNGHATSSLLSDGTLFCVAPLLEKQLPEPLPS
jgi:hypothetical protein